MSVLKQELESLQNRFVETELRMEKLEYDFWRNGGICCPGCGIEGWHDLEEKQLRRQQRIDQLKSKLKESNES